MAHQYDTMMEPPIEELLDRAGSKFALVVLGSTRAREINSYYGQLGDGLGRIVPPQVTSIARKPLSIAFEEIDAGKIVPIVREDDPVEDLADELDETAALVEAVDN